MGGRFGGGGGGGGSGRVGSGSSGTLSAEKSLTLPVSIVFEICTYKIAL